MYLAKTPSIIKNSLPKAIWAMPQKSKSLYLTFDDGPTPRVTPWVLETLDQYKAKATFFCVGSQVEAHPGIYKQIRDKGHTVGNHTYTHKNGWFTRKNRYFRDVLSCSEFVDSNLFRPPYGKLMPGQYSALKERFKIIMWDVLSGDFDRSLSDEACLQNVIQNAEEGSIVVFHDSEKAEQKLRYALPAALEHFARKGFAFKAID